VELPGIEPDAEIALSWEGLRFKYAKRRETACGYATVVDGVSFQFSPVRYLRIRSHVLTASRRLTQVRAGVSLSPEEIVEVFRVDKRAAADLNERQLF